MTDCILNPIPTNAVDADEKGISAHYAVPCGQLARYSYPKNQHSTYGVAYDLTTKGGNPQIGEKFGIRSVDTAANYWRGATVTQGVGFVLDYEVMTAPTAARTVVTNGGEHQFRVDVAGTVAISLNNGVTWTTSPTSMVGVGRIHVAADHDGTNQRLWINRRIAAQTAVALSVPAGGNLDVGQHGTVRRLAIPSSWVRTPNQRYLAEFAEKVNYAWRPRLVGEGPTAGIATGSVGEGDYYCPSGGVSLRFYYRQPTVLNRYGHLRLWGDQQSGRIALMHPKMPSFGSWEFVFEWLGGTPTFGLAPDRTTTWNMAASGMYWWRATAGAGGLGITFNRDNVLLGTFVVPLPRAGGMVRIVPTRHPSGDWRHYIKVEDRWYGGFPVINDVTYLSSNYIMLQPDGSFIESAKKLLGELDPFDESERIALEVSPFAP